MNDYNQNSNFVGSSKLGGPDHFRAIAEAQMSMQGEKMPELAAINDRLGYVQKRIYETVNAVRSNMDRILGAIPESDGSLKAAPFGAGSIGEIQSMISEIEACVTGLELQSRRLNSL